MDAQTIRQAQVNQLSRGPCRMDTLYQAARESNPRRWSGQTRDWTPIGAVTLNPERDIVVQTATVQTLMTPG